MEILCINNFLLFRIKTQQEKILTVINLPEIYYIFMIHLLQHNKFSAFPLFQLHCFHREIFIFKTCA